MNKVLILIMISSVCLTMTLARSKIDSKEFSAQNEFDGKLITYLVKEEPRLKVFFPCQIKLFMSGNILPWHFNKPLWCQCIKINPDFNADQYLLT